MIDDREPENREPTTLDLATAWLVEWLEDAGADGVESVELTEDAKAHGHTFGTVMRARQRLGDKITMKKNVGAKGSAGGGLWPRQRGSDCLHE